MVNIMRRTLSRDEEKAMFAKMHSGKEYRKTYDEDTKGYSTVKIVSEYRRPKEIGPITKETVERVKKADDTTKIAKNIYQIGKPYKLKYQGTHTTTILMQRKNGQWYYYDIPTDKQGKLPERVIAQRVLDIADGDRQGHQRSVFLDVGIDAEHMWDPDKPVDRAQTYRWYLHPNESDIRNMDDKNSKIYEVLKETKTSKRCILLSGGTDEQRDAIAQSIEKNYTVAEKKVIAGNLITIGATPKGVAGYYSQQTDDHNNPIGCAEIRVNPEYAKEDSDVVIHECIHLLRDHDAKRDPHLRAVKKYRGKDADLEESMTEAETVSRQRPFTKDKSPTGYYHYVRSKDKTTGEIIREDRIIINNPKDKNKFREKGKKGKSAQKAVIKNYPKSNISKMKNKGDAEAIDSYYNLENRKGQPDSSQTHIQTYAPKGNISQEKSEDTMMKSSAQHVTKWKDKKAIKIK